MSILFKALLIIPEVWSLEGSDSGVLTVRNDGLVKLAEFTVLQCKIDTICKSVI